MDTVLADIPPMVAEASLSNLQSGSATTEIAVAQGQTSGKARYNANPQLAELQHEMFRLAMDKELDPAKKTAAANTFVKLEERRRLNLGKANPAPVKSEPKRRSRQSGPIEPAPKPVEPINTTVDKPSLPSA